MEISNNLNHKYTNQFVTGTGNIKKQQEPEEFLIKTKANKGIDEKGIASENTEKKEALKEASREMIAESPVLGEFKDLEGFEQRKDMSIGPDIHYALSSNNVDFLKRLQWGGLTVGEYREVNYRIRELEMTKAENPNLLPGKIIDEDRSYEPEILGSKEEPKIDIMV
jgi:hypothetical protein